MTSRTTVLAVVISIAVLTAVALGGAIYLSGVVLEHPEKVDAAALGLVAGLTGLAGTGLGALAGMLASTRSTLGQRDVEPTAISGVIPIPTRPVDPGVAAGGAAQ